MLHFALPHDHKLSRTLDAPARPMTPDRYLTLRRLAAGLSRNDVAGSLARRHGKSFENARLLITQLETPRIVARHRRTLDALEAILPIDPNVYFQLADEPADRHPFVCGRCGCSGSDTCSGPKGVCTPVTGGSCSRCIDAGIAQAVAA